jgi:hypothetical protein
VSLASTVNRNTAPQTLRPPLLGERQAGGCWWRRHIVVGRRLPAAAGARAVDQRLGAGTWPRNYALLFTSAPIRRVLTTTARICIFTTIVTLLLAYVVGLRADARLGRGAAADDDRHPAAAVDVGAGARLRLGDLAAPRRAW